MKSVPIEQIIQLQRDLVDRLLDAQGACADGLAEALELVEDILMDNFIGESDEARETD